jgi:hypothetical protein
MALTITGSTYAGEFAGKYIAAALLSAPTLEKGGLTIHPNVKFKQVIQRVATGNIVANASCDFSDSTTVTLTERVLAPEEFQVNLQLCALTLGASWQAAEMGYSAYNSIPKTFEDFILAHVAEKVASSMETTIWTGANATAGQFDGISTQIAADANLPSAQEIAAVSGGVLASNVIAQLGLIVDAIPARLYGVEDLKIYVSQNIYKAYIRSLGGFGASGVGAAGVNAQGTNQVLGDVFFDGIPVFMANGLAANTAIATPTSNLHFATGLLNEMNEARVIDMRPVDGSQNFRVVLRFTADAKYGFAEDVVTYGITNSAN